MKNAREFIILISSFFLSFVFPVLRKMSYYSILRVQHPWSPVNVTVTFLALLFTCRVTHRCQTVGKSSFLRVCDSLCKIFIFALLWLGEKILKHKNSRQLSLFLSETFILIFGMLQTVSVALRVYGELLTCIIFDIFSFVQIIFCR